MRGQGSIRFNGEWQLIDLCFVSPALADAASFSVLEPPFLTERDAAHSGEKPLRTYSGPRYLGGVSDHRPILVRITLPKSSGHFPVSHPSWFSSLFPSSTYFMIPTSPALATLIDLYTNIPLTKLFSVQKQMKLATTPIT